MLGIELNGVRVIAAGGFDTATRQSTGIDYAVEVSSDAPADRRAYLKGKLAAGRSAAAPLTRPASRQTPAPLAAAAPVQLPCVARRPGHPAHHPPLTNPLAPDA